MNIIQMQQFKAIAYHQNLSKAAKELCISAPALSQVLRILEDELGCELFDRIGRNIYLNENGKLLLKYFDRILSHYDKNCQKIYEHFQSMPKDNDKPLRLLSLGGNILDILLVRFAQTYPSVPVQVDTQPFKKSLDLLLRKQVDVAFTDDLSLAGAGKMLDKENIKAIYLLENCLYLNVLRSSIYASRDQISIKELLDEEFVCFPSSDLRGFVLSGLIHKMCQAEQIKLKYSKTYSYDELRKVMFSMPYLAIVDTITTSFFKGSPKIKIKIAEASARQSIYLCYRSTNKRAVLLAEYIKKNFYYPFYHKKLL